MWWREVGGLRIEAWFIPPPQSEGTAPALLFAHPSDGLIDDWAPQVARYREMGFAILLPEYRGYGRSDGAPSEAALLEDFVYFFDRLVDHRDIDRERVVLHGRELGGGVVGVLAGQRRPAALILESTFTNTPDLLSAGLVPSAAVEDRFDTRGVLRTISTPLLVLHGANDQVVPIRHAIENERVSYNAQLIALNAGHDLERSEEGYWQPIARFLRRRGVLRPSRVNNPDE